MLSADLLLRVHGYRELLSSGGTLRYIVVLRRGFSLNESHDQAKLALVQTQI